MSEVKAWKVSEYSSLDGQRRGVAYDPSSPNCRRILEFSAAATEAEVRQVCALPQIMAALRELSEARTREAEAAAIGRLHSLYGGLK